MKVFIGITCLPGPMHLNTLYFTDLLVPGVLSLCLYVCCLLVVFVVTMFVYVVCSYYVVYLFVCLFGVLCFIARMQFGKPLDKL